MTVAKLDKRVGDLSARADALVERMEEAAARYLDAITPWVAGRFSATVDAAVSGAPEITQEIGQEGLSRLRAALDVLAAATPDLVRKRAGAPGAWPHRWVGGTPIAVGFYGGKTGSAKRQVAVPPFLETRLRLLLGTAGHVLDKHGYRRHVRRTCNRAYVRSDYHPPEYLARSLEGHEQFLPILSEYGDLCDEYAGILIDLGRAGHERAERLAEDLWKQT
jgi:hypothetical protein